MKRVQRIERVGDGVRVTLADGSTATYANAAQVPDELVALLGRMDAADGGDGDGQPQGDARARYQQRLEQAHQQGQVRAIPGDSVAGLDGYRQRLESGWQQDTRKTRLPKAKHWGGA